MDKPSPKVVNPILTARLDYAGRGWPTFPAPVDGPNLKMSLKKACEETHNIRWGATDDSDVIRAEFNGKIFGVNGCSLRKQNIGLPTGVLPRIFVIETDTAGGDHDDDIDGDASLKAWEAVHGELPPTLMQRSPSGSIHRFFKHPGPGIKIKSFPAIFGEGCGVDCKGDKGMVLVAPSFIPPKRAKNGEPAKAGGYYTWINEGHDIAVPSPALLEVVVDKPEPIIEPTAPNPFSNINQGSDGARTWAEAALNNEAAIVGSTGQGGRNNQLHKSACNLGEIVGGGALSEDEVVDALMIAAKANGSIKNESASDKRACRNTIASGLTKGKLQPRHYIPRIADTMEWIEPTAPAANFATIEAARLETENLIDDFLNPNVFIRYVIWLSENRSYPHIASALRIDTGVGKTSIAVKKITRSSNKTIVFAVPTLELADRVAQQFVNLGVVAPVFRGMNADDPENPGEEMCLNPDAVALALKVMAKVSSSCCKNKEDQCEFFESCGYQSQIARVKQDKRRVIIVAADMLFHENTTIGTPYGVVIDESSWQKQLRGIDDDERFFMPFSMMRKHGMLHTHLADELSKQQESGGLRRRFIDGMDNLTNLINEQWKQKPDIGLRPGMSKRQIERLKKSELIDEAVYSRQIIEIIKELRQMFDDPEIESSGRLLLDEKDGQRGIRWRGVAPIAKQYRRPTLILDATLPDLSVLRVTHPGAEIDSDISVALPPCVSVRQVIAAPTSSSKLINSDAKKPERHRESLRRYILRRRIETGKELTLVICQMEVEEWLRKRLPKEIQLAHFNAIAGLDIYRDVRLIILAGRVQPGPEAVEVRAATLSGAMPIKILTKANGFEWFDQVRRGIRLRDGSGIAVKGDQHPDEFCEAIRWQICEAELVQAFGRARAINRTEETPLDVDLLFNTVLPPLQGNNKRS